MRKTDTPDYGMLTVTGRFVSYVEPDPGKICAYDIAHALSQSARFAGQTTRVVNTAAHSLLVQRLLGQHLIQRHMAVDGGLLQAALLHDAAEAYMGDMPYPLILATGTTAIYQKTRQKLERAIGDAFGFDSRQFDAPELASIDRALPYIEMKLFQADAPPVDPKSPLAQLVHWMSQAAQLSQIRAVYALNAADSRDLYISALNGLRTL